ncbi:MAG: 7-cyano-7-deazaguanine synthase QueC [Sulfurimonas sp.]|jgi:7-cyano-7-deazaguanine synthase|nr:7-cyano-7-deazaguanine synthase QueC [Sulfurimonadaceae bacterium]
MKKAVAIMSGGLDSTLCAYMLKDEGYEVVALHFNYSQKTQQKELESFGMLCNKLDITNRYILDIDFFNYISASSLIDKAMSVPTDGLSDSVPSTYVPFRNGIFLSIAAALAEKEGAGVVAIGVVEEDSSGYPDCREGFIKSMQNSINLGIKDETNIELYTPIVHLSKEQIVKKSLELGVALELTWSCYQAQDEACGVCDSCRLRLNGFKKAKAVDPIKYKNS